MPASSGLQETIRFFKVAHLVSATGQCSKVSHGIRCQLSHDLLQHNPAMSFYHDGGISGLEHIFCVVMLWQRSSGRLHKLSSAYFLTSLPVL